MSTFKEKYLSSIAKRISGETILDSYIDKDIGSVVPSFRSLFSLANIKFNDFSLLINSLSYSKPISNPLFISSNTFLETLKDVKIYTKSLIEASTLILNEYILNTSKYTKITQRFLYSDSKINNKINQLTKYQCSSIDIISDIDNDKTTSFSFGNYVTLPFCIENSTLYTSLVNIAISSNEEITFDNTSEINTLPLTTPVLVKYYGTESITENAITFNITLNTTLANLIYINTYGNITSIQLNILDTNGISIYTSKIDDREALFTFDKIEITSIQIIFTLANYNTNMQSSFELSEFTIMNNVNFSPRAIFETRQIEIEDYENINSVNINAINYEGNINTGFNKYVSVSFNDENKDFYRMDTITGTTVPISKLTLTNKFDIAPEVIESSRYTITSKIASTLKPVSSEYFKYEITDDLMKFQKAKVLIGTNDSYCSYTSNTSPSNDYLQLENWTRVDNFYRTMVYNNEQGIFVDIGLNQIKLNNSSVTGVVNIPIGISMIEVHESLFDPTLSGLIEDYTSENIFFDQSKIIADNLFPYNFIYKLSGLPKYFEGSMIDGNMENVSIYGTTIVQLDSPVFPFSVKVTGTGNVEYKLHIGNIPLYPGTFTVEPSSGVIRINSLEESISGDFEDTVAITYIKASEEIRPCGFLFNRLSTYIDYKSIYNMLSIIGISDSTFFTYIADGVSKYLLIPNVENIYHNKILYGTFTDNMFVSTKFDLFTKNQFITPTLKNIFIQGIK